MTSLWLTIIEYVGYAFAVVAFIWLAYERGFSQGCYHILNQQIDEKIRNLAELEGESP